MRPASSTAESGMFSCSQVSVITVMQLPIRLLTSHSFISSILLTRERVLARKMLGTAGLCGVAVSFALMPARLPRFWRLLQRRRHFFSVRSVRRIISGEQVESLRDPAGPILRQADKFCSSVSPSRCVAANYGGAPGRCVYTRHHQAVQSRTKSQAKSSSRYMSELF